MPEMFVRKENRRVGEIPKRFLYTRGLAVVAILLATTTPSKANDSLWTPYLEFEGRGSEVRATAQSNIFAPIWQNEGTLVFADIRGQVTDQSTSEGNFGLGLRTILDRELIFGAYGFYDIKESPFGNTFHQATTGLELLAVDWGARINGYLPNQSPQSTGTPAIATIRDGNLLVLSGQEAAYWGLDVEYEHLFWERSPTVGSTPGRLGEVGIEWWASAAVFHFDSSEAGFPAITGPRFRTELRLYDLPYLGRDSRLVFSGQFEHDAIRDAVATGLINVRIPFGRASSSDTAPRSGLSRRMLNPIIRDVDVVSNAVMDRRQEAASLANGNGNAISGVTVVDAATVTPHQVIADAGPSSLIVLDGSQGTIELSESIDVQVGQLLIGGGELLAVRGASSQQEASIRLPGSRPLIESSASDAIAASSGSRLRSFDLMSTLSHATGVTLTDATNVEIYGLSIAFANDVENANGIRATGATNFELANAEITTPSDGISLDNTASAKITDTSITVTELGPGGIAVSVGDSSAATLEAVNISTLGNRGWGIAVSGEAGSLRFSGGSIRTFGDESVGVLALGDVSIELNDVDIETGDAAAGTGYAAHGIFATLGDVQLAVNGGSITVNTSSLEDYFPGIRGPYDPFEFWLSPHSRQSFGIVTFNEPSDAISVSVDSVAFSTYDHSVVSVRNPNFATSDQKLNLTLTDNSFEVLNDGYQLADYAGSARVTGIWLLGPPTNLHATGNVANLRFLDRAGIAIQFPPSSSLTQQDFAQLGAENPGIQIWADGRSVSFGGPAVPLPVAPVTAE